MDSGRGFLIRKNRLRGVKYTVGKESGLEDTISYIGTPFGEGGIGIIRLSGPMAREILGRIFVRPREDGLEERKLSYGRIVDPDSGKTLDEVLACFMPGPHTYTGEDVAEINCHGGAVPLRSVLELTYRMGARPAERGEFTKRAFLNGRLDLSQAEAVMDIVKAKAEKSFDVAMDQLAGKLSREIGGIRKKLMDILVDLTVNIDYPDEDIEEITYEKLKNEIASAEEDVSMLLGTADTGRIVSEGLRTAIVGKPNVGKSSLMNALLREQRAIVTDIPGTTRDTIEESLSVSGIPVVLTDTAGIRETDDKIETIGIERSKDCVKRADLVIFMTDSSVEHGEEDRLIAAALPPEKTLIVLNKSDLGEKTGEAGVRKMLGEAGKDEKALLGIVKTSVLEEEGIRELEEKIAALSERGMISQEESQIVTNARHADLLRKADRSLMDAASQAEAGEPLEVIEIDVHDAYTSLGEIIGEEVTSDILDEVFSRFCLGK